MDNPKSHWCIMLIMNLTDHKNTLKKGNKYGSKKTDYNGVIYDSKREANFAAHLDYLKHTIDPREKVVDVKRQVPFPVQINNQHICKYLADFVVTYSDGRTEVIDVKGFKTEVYRLKKKMVEAQYKISIIEK